ncbi:hypothetical protein A7982_13158 [Minicystis rosea]|nr:hypothetical protein A7982_13158 [Minicystis rosea]
MDTVPASGSCRRVVTDATSRGEEQGCLSIARARTPFELAIEPLVQAAALAPALRDPVAEVRRYLRA